MQNLYKNCSQILSSKLSKTVYLLSKSKSGSKIEFILGKKTPLNHACVILYQKANIWH